MSKCTYLLSTSGPVYSHTLCSLCLQPLWQLHPAGIHSHTQLLIPDHLSAAAASLLTEVRSETPAKYCSHCQYIITHSQYESLCCSTVTPVRCWLPFGFRRRRRERHQVSSLLQQRLLESSELLAAPLWSLRPALELNTESSHGQNGAAPVQIPGFLCILCFPKKNDTIKTETWTKAVVKHVPSKHETSGFNIWTSETQIWWELYLWCNFNIFKFYSIHACKLTPHKFWQLYMFRLSAFNYCKNTRILGNKLLPLLYSWHSVHCRGLCVITARLYVSYCRAGLLFKVVRLFHLIISKYSITHHIYRLVTRLKA